MALSKYVLFIERAAPESRAEFQDSYLKAARQITETTAGTGRLVVNLVGETPAEVPFRPANDDAGIASTRYDVIVEVTPPEDDATSIVGRLRACLPDIGRTHIYRVEEFVQLDRQRIVVGERSPGIKYVGLLMFHADLPDSAARRSWDLHVPLALKVHVGMAKYVRNWIVEAQDGPAARGIAELHFPTFDDMVEGYFDSERGKSEILQDISHFIASGTRSFVSEFVLRE